MLRYPVLMYHAINSTAHPYKCGHEGEEYYVTDIDKFRKQMQVISDLKLGVVLLREVEKMGAERASGPSRSKPIVITFDDGHESGYYNALPVLNHFGFRAEFFVTAGWIGKGPYLKRYQLAELKDHRMSVQSHGWSHRFLSELNDVDLMTELAESRSEISRIIGADVDYLSYPGGRFDERTERMAKSARYRGSCTSMTGMNAAGKEMYGLKRYAITSHTPEKYFRALITDDVSYFARKEARRLVGATVRRFLNDKNCGRVRSCMRIMGVIRD